MRKKILAVGLVLVMLFLCGCSKSDSSNTVANNQKETKDVKNLLDVSNTQSNTDSYVTVNSEIKKSKTTKENTKKEVKKSEFVVDYSKKPAALSNSTYLKIKTEFLNNIKKENAREKGSLTVNDINIPANRFYGTYNGAYVFCITQSNYRYLNQITRYDVSNLNFFLPDSKPLYVYKNGTFYDIEEAYSKKILTYDDVANIAKNFTKYFGEMDLDDKPENLDINIFRSIKQDYLNYIKPNTKDKCFPVYNINNVKIRDYLGVSNNAYAMRIGISGQMYLTALTEKTVAGIKYTLPNSQDITIYKSGKFYSIKTAYEKNIITKADVQKFVKKFID